MNPSCTSTPVQTCISSSSTRSKKRGVNWWVRTSSFLRRLAIHQSSETAWKLRTHSIEHLLGSQTIIVNPLHIFTGTHLDMGNHVTPSTVYISYILESPLPSCYASKNNASSLILFLSRSCPLRATPNGQPWSSLMRIWFRMPFSPCKTGVSGHSPTPSAGDFEALVDSGSPSRISLQKELHWILKNVKNRRSPSCRKNPS